MSLVLSLFPGIGLLDMAFEAEGFTVVRGPDCLWGGDIRWFHPPSGRFDGIIGGPPCQTFSSLARLVRASGREPKFGNLIPEFERCVGEAAPAWFLMENVPAAPEPSIAGYAVDSFLLNNAWLLGDDGLGQEQERTRRFSFGTHGPGPAPNLLRWIDLAVLLLPKGDRCGTLTQYPTDNSPEAKRRSRTVTALGTEHLANLRASTNEHRVRRGDGTATHDSLDNVTEWSKRRRQKTVGSHPGLEVIGKGGKAKRQEIARQKAVRAGAVTGSDGGASVRMRRCRLIDALRLQGLPDDFLADAPFTAEGKLKAVANGVPIPMGRAIARAVREATKA